MIACRRGWPAAGGSSGARSIAGHARAALERGQRPAAGRATEIDAGLSGGRRVSQPRERFLELLVGARRRRLVERNRRAPRGPGREIGPAARQRLRGRRRHQQALALERDHLHQARPRCPVRADLRGRTIRAECAPPPRLEKLQQLPPDELDAAAQHRIGDRRPGVQRERSVAAVDHRLDHLVRRLGEPLHRRRPHLDHARGRVAARRRRRAPQHPRLAAPPGPAPVPVMRVRSNRSPSSAMSAGSNPAVVTNPSTGAL